MQERSFSYSLLATGLAVALAGCGGGGGGGGEPDTGEADSVESPSGVDYAGAGGNTDPAQLDEGTAAELVVGVLGGAESVSSMQPPTSGSSKAIVAGATTNSSDTLQDGCGGTQTWSMTETTWTFEYDNWHQEASGNETVACSDSSVRNGEMKWVNNGVTEAEATESQPWQWDLSMWEKVTYPDGSWEGSDASFTLTAPNGYQGVTFEASGEERSPAGTVEKFADFKVETDGNGLLKTFSGRFYDFDNGYVDVETTTPFVYDCNAYWPPGAGVMEIRGDSTWTLNAQTASCDTYVVSDGSVVEERHWQ